MKTFKQHIIVDGYNFILRTDRIDPSDDEALWRARERLIHQLVAYRGNKQLQITIVFDGQDVKLLGKIPRPSGIHVLFSRAPQKADLLILKRIDQSTKKGNIILVTSDRPLALLARAQGCQIQSVEDFRFKISKREKQENRNKYDQKMSKAELEEWLELFNSKTIKNGQNMGKEHEKP
ncbi:MAG: hypothetical protein GWP06_04155 [Actinobacteria bacterium]|nr:hypothetical protein [Actinomycetota bacterium]